MRDTASSASRTEHPRPHARRSLAEVLDELQQIAASGNAESRTLPPDVYDNQELFDLEVERLFRPGWIMVGREYQVKNPGDFMLVDVIDEPLVVTRDAAGQVHVLSRVCRHRWMPVCEGSGNASVLECPYHAWTYEMDGRLRGAPEMNDSPCFSRRELGLFPIRHDTWEGFIFVNLDGRAEPLAPRMEPLRQQLAEYRLAECG